MPHGGKKVIATKPTLGCLQKCGNYKRYKFVNRKHKVSISAHTLVAEAFLGDKPSQNAVLIHIDEDATNNKVGNLKWGTQKENLNCSKFIAYCKTRTGDDSPARKGKMNKIY